MLSPTQALIYKRCAELASQLVRKNQRYGDSAIKPLRMFSHGGVLEQIAVRLDDKLSRMRNMGGLAAVMQSKAPDGEDVVQDMLGYLILAQVAAGQPAQPQPPQPDKKMTIRELARRSGLTPNEIYESLRRDEKAAKRKTALEYLASIPAPGTTLMAAMNQQGK